MVKLLRWTLQDQNVDLCTECATRSTASESMGIEMIYRGIDISMVPFDDVAEYNRMCEHLGLARLQQTLVCDRKFWLNSHYASIDVYDYVMKLTPDSAEARARVQSELALYESNNLMDVLRLLIYMVDHMRQHHVVWGVGRGSSVASYVLYLIGVHRIDSLKFQLDIREFIKD